MQEASKKQKKRGVVSADPMKKLSILIEINQAVSRTLDLMESLQSTLLVLQSSYKIKSGAAFVVNEDRQSLTMAASIGYRKDVAKTKYKMGEGLTGRIAETETASGGRLPRASACHESQHARWRPTPRRASGRLRPSASTPAGGAPPWGQAD